MKTFKAVLRMKRKTDTEGIVNIRVTENRKSEYLPMDIKLPPSVWDKAMGRVRKTKELDYDSINTAIEDKLKDTKRLYKQEGINKLAKKASFLHYYEEYITRINKKGSRDKYAQVLTHLKAFRKKDLLYADINSKLVYDFHNYLMQGASKNTTNHYLKLFKQVLHKAVEEHEYTYLRDPFLGFEFKYTKVAKSALEPDEIRKMIQTPIEDTDSMYNVRNCFLTQVFLQGMRVSDLQLMRWNMIKGENFEYTMFKTNNYMRVFINDLVWYIFIHQFKKLAEKEGLDISAERYLEPKVSEGGLQIIDDSLEQRKRESFMAYKYRIIQFANDKMHKDRFIFDFLQGVDFSNIKNNDFSKVTDEQYDKMCSNTIVYNRHLKKLQQRVGITTTLKSHLSRHSYAYMLLNSGVDVYDISQSLGHIGGLQVTEKYLKGLTTGKTAELNRQIAENFLV